MRKEEIGETHLNDENNNNKNYHYQRTETELGRGFYVSGSRVLFIFVGVPLDYKLQDFADQLQKQIEFEFDELVEPSTPPPDTPHAVRLYHFENPFRANCHCYMIFSYESATRLAFTWKHLQDTEFRSANSFGFFVNFDASAKEVQTSHFFDTFEANFVSKSERLTLTKLTSPSFNVNFSKVLAHIQTSFPLPSTQKTAKIQSDASVTGDVLRQKKNKSNFSQNFTLPQLKKTKTKTKTNTEEMNIANLRVASNEMRAYFVSVLEAYSRSIGEVEEKETPLIWAYLYTKNLSNTEPTLTLISNLEITAIHKHDTGFVLHLHIHPCAFFELWVLLQTGSVSNFLSQNQVTVESIWTAHEYIGALQKLWREGNMSVLAARQAKGFLERVRGKTSELYQKVCECASEQIPNDQQREAEILQEWNSKRERSVHELQEKVNKLGSIIQDNKAAQFDSILEDIPSQTLNWVLSNQPKLLKAIFKLERVSMLQTLLAKGFDSTAHLSKTESITYLDYAKQEKLTKMMTVIEQWEQTPTWVKTKLYHANNSLTLRSHESNYTNNLVDLLDKSLEGFKHATHPISKKEIQLLQFQTLQYHERTKTQIFETFLTEIKKNLNFEEVISREYDTQVHFAAVGPISVGKSTMWNALLHLDLPIGLSRTTTDAKLVFPQGEKVPAVHKQFAWDVPGNEKDFNFLNPETMQFFYSLDYCLLLFNTDIEDPKISEMARLIYTVHPTSLLLIRTQVDNVKLGNQKPVSEVLEEDRKAIKNLLGAPVPVIAISAKNVLKNSANKFDWNILEKLWDQLPRNSAEKKQEKNKNVPLVLDLSPFL